MARSGASIQAPDLLGNKISINSELLDLLCCMCGYPVVKARQVMGCGCRICELCFLQFERSQAELTCRKCHKPFNIDQTFRDRASDNELKRRAFPCFHPNCPWEGDAFAYREHVKKCKFAQIKCSHPGCDTVFPKVSQRDHESMCQYRPKPCDYCGKQVQLVNKMQHELKECQEYIINCPSGCGESFPRKKTKKHIEHSCKKQTRPCPYMRYGCTVKATFDGIKKHKKDNVSDHLEMIEKFFSESKLLQSNGNGSKAAVNVSEARVSEFRTEMNSLYSELNHQLNKVTEETVRLDTMLQDMQVSFQELGILIQTLQATSYNGEFIWKIPEVKRRTEEALLEKTVSLYSAPFFTSRFGYKLCLRLYLNGDGSGKGTHISFFLTIMKGEYDALLSWPFSRLVTLTLLNQQSKAQHIIQRFKPEPSSSSFWRPHSEMNIASGCPQFAPISVLNNSHYVYEDTMFFKVVIADS